MKPKLQNIKHISLCLITASIFLVSCDLKQKELINDPNIRTIELIPETPYIPSLELNATREELSQYDCDINWILFDYNSSALSNKAKLELEKVALIIEQNSNFKARIRAYTDSKGRKEYNEILSARRANSAKQYLISEGISAKNISIDSYADAKPIALNTEDDTGRMYNRRIELFVLDNLNNTVCRTHPPEIPKSLKVEVQ